MEIYRVLTHMVNSVPVVALHNSFYLLLSQEFNFLSQLYHIFHHQNLSPILGKFSNFSHAHIYTQSLVESHGFPRFKRHHEAKVHNSTPGHVCLVSQIPYCTKWMNTSRDIDEFCYFTRILAQMTKVEANHIMIMSL